MCSVLLGENNARECRCCFRREFPPWFGNCSERASEKERERERARESERERERKRERDRERVCVCVSERERDQEAAIT